MPPREIFQKGFYPFYHVHVVRQKHLGDKISLIVMDDMACQLSTIAEICDSSILSGLSDVDKIKDGQLKCT